VLEDFDDDHPAAAARARRVMVCRSVGLMIRVVVLGRPPHHG